MCDSTINFIIPIRAAKRRLLSYKTPSRWNSTKSLITSMVKLRAKGISVTKAVVLGGIAGEIVMLHSRSGHAN